MVALLRDVQVLVGVEGQARRSAKLSRIRAAAAPLAEEVLLLDIRAVEFNGGVEDGNAVEPLVGDVGQSLLSITMAVGQTKRPSVSPSPPNLPISSSSTVILLMPKTQSPS